MLNETHDPKLQSWVTSAQSPTTDFPIQNLPYAVFAPLGSGDWRIGVAIGDEILDLRAAVASGHLKAPAPGVLDGDALNELMGLGRQAWSPLRLALSRALRMGSPDQAALESCLIAQTKVQHRVPARIGDYTDFYTSIHHATRVGSLFRPDNPLLPNYKWVPIGYHGRASSIGISGEAFHRPVGQLMPPGASEPIVAPCKRLDYELELGIFIGSGNAQGEPISIEQAEDHVFGVSLFNDWSARDIQAWEYQPLGPFLSKNFASTLSPWVVTLEALAPYRIAFSHPAGDPQPLPYLDSANNRIQGALDIQLEVLLRTQKMRDSGLPAERLSQTSYRHAYWTVAQLLTHHTVNGCNLQPGDLLGTGTLSGLEQDESGSLLELNQGGKQPIPLSNGELRTFLEDNDEIVITGSCQKPGAARIGFGICSGIVLPARH